MTHDPSPPTAAMLAEILRIPYALKRRTVELYFDLLQALLAQLDHYVILDRSNPIRLATIGSFISSVTINPRSHYCTRPQPENTAVMIRWRFSSNHEMRGGPSVDVYGGVFHYQN
jgi:hypothetical protein